MGYLLVGPYLEIYEHYQQQNLDFKRLLSRRMYVEELKWRPPPLLWIPLLVSGCLLVFVDVFQYETYRTPPIALPQPRFLGFSEDKNMKGFLIRTPGCKIPDLSANDSSIEEFLFKETAVECNDGVPPLVGSNSTSLFLLNDSLTIYSINDISLLKCCYTPFWRTNPSDNRKDDKVTFGSKCVEFNESANVEGEFVMVSCFHNRTKIYKDFFAFVPVNTPNTTNTSQPPLNVLIIGLDAVSRLNFHRQMPKTFSALNKLKAVELLGYNKVGDNTFPNLIPVLTGLSEDELKRACWEENTSYFDECAFIWKDFKQKGFTTAFAEDASWMGIFNYQKRGFAKQPTDYYWGTFNREAEKQIGNQHRLNVYQCVGGREVYKVLLQYVETFAKTMHENAIPYLGFFWGSSLSHDLLNKPQLGDDKHESLISELSNSGVLNKTALIVMSDHGIRWGGIRSTFQGRIEERLPFVFVYLPKWYREEFSAAFSNLIRNARRLTTPYDLHETLIDLTDPFKLTREFLGKRAEKQNTRRGYSLFDSISEERTCEAAGISSHWCTCQKSVQIDTSVPAVVEAANFTIDHINNQLEGYASCVTLELDEILDARLLTHDQHMLEKRFSQDYTVVVRTKPGGGLFESTVRRKILQKEYNYEITGTISRINLYGQQSSCMTDFHLKLYCYCSYLL